jgi:Tfp pilus assembly protein PilN
MIELYKTYEPKIKKTQDREDVLKSRIGTLYQTALSRSIWLDVLKNISEILPQDIWITDISGVISIEKSSFGRLDLNGRALSYQSVNNFVSMLKSSKNFKEVKPVSSSVDKDIKTLEEVVKFSITMDVVVGDS